MTDKAIVPCDKLSNQMWTYTSDQFKFLLEHPDFWCKCREELKDKKGNLLKGTDGKPLATPFQLSNDADYGNVSQLEPVHREILFAVISLYEQGCRRLKLTEAVEVMTGGVRTRTLFDEYRDLFKKLACTWITVKLTPLFNACPKYSKNYKGKWTLRAPLLPCQFIEGEDKTSRTLVIELTAESPLMRVAKAKNQIMAYDTAPLAIPNQNHTTRVVVIKNWLLRRVELAKQGRWSSTIRVDSFYEECGLADGSKRQKQQARNLADKVLSHLKEQNVIRDFEWRKDGRAYDAIVLTF